MAALKEWPVKRRLSGPRVGSNTSQMELLSFLRVRFRPVSNLNTGWSGPLHCDKLDSAYRDFTGQTLWPGKENMSTKSPPVVLFLLTFTWMIMCPLFTKFTSFQRRVSAQFEFFSELGRISPSLKDPKNAVVHADHNTC